MRAIDRILGPLAVTAFLAGGAWADIFTFVGQDPGGEFGASVAGIGDVNGDGFPDVLVGAPTDNTPGSNAGRAFVYSGKNGVLLHSFSGPAQSTTGKVVASAGDADGDGVLDLVIAAPVHDLAGFNAGAVAVVSGKDYAHVWTATGTNNGDRFGSSIALLGDLDGDGRDDLLVGAPENDLNGGNAGAAYVVSGKDGSTLKALYGSWASMRFGDAVGGGGDVDQDGVPDLAVGCPLDDLPASNAGRAFVYSGSGYGLLHQVWGSQGDQLGRQVSLAGDFDGDGADDLVFSATHVDPHNQGVVRVHSIQKQAEQYAVLGSNSSANLGASLAVIGDVDFDGVPDLAIGATGTKEVRIVSGKSGIELLVHPGNGGFGESVAGAGDIDQDGVPDLVVGAPYQSHLGSTVGVARVLSGLVPTPKLCLDSAQKIDATWEIDGAPPAKVTRLVSNCGAPQTTLGFQVKITPPVAWLSATPSSGTAASGGAPTPVDLQFSVQGLAAGTYQTTVRFENTNDATDGVSIPVTLDVKAPGPTPDLCLAAGTKVDFKHVIGATSPPPAKVQVKNCGPVGTVLGYQVSDLGGATWLTATPTSGSVAAGGSKDVTVAAAPAGMPAGTYGSTLRFSNVALPSDFFDVPVTLTVSAPPAGPDLCLSTNAVHVTSTAAHVFTVDVADCAGSPEPLSWNVSLVDVSDATWVSFTPKSGVVTSGEAYDTATVTLEPDGLAPGTHHATLRFKNVAKPGQDHEDVAITLHVVEQSFVPPATLHGVVAPGEADEASFEAVAGTKLKLKMRAPSGGEFRVLVDGPLGPVADWIVKGTKKKKKSVKLTADGPYQIVVLASGGAAAFEIGTSWKLPKSAKTKKHKKVKPKASGVAILEIAGVAGSAFDASFKVKKNGGYGLLVGLETPGGQSFDLGPYTIPGALVGVPMPETGTYALRITGYWSKKSYAHVKVQPTPPLPSGDVWLD